MFTVYDFCYLAVDDSQLVRVYDMNPDVQREVLCLRMRAAMYDDDYSGCEVQSYDIDNDGIVLNIDTSGE